MFHYNLGQLFPSSNTVDTLFTAPAVVGVSNPVYIIDSLFVTNLDFQSSDDLVSIWIVKSGDSATQKNALLNNYPISKGENIVKGTIYMFPGDKIMVESHYGKSSFQVFGRMDVASFKIASLQSAVVAGTSTPAEEEELVILMGGAIQTNTNNCNCP